MIRRWDIIAPGWGVIRTLSGCQYEPRAGFLGFSQPYISQRCWCFHTLFGCIDPGGVRVRPLDVGEVDVWKDV